MLRSQLYEMSFYYWENLEKETGCIKCQSLFRRHLYDMSSLFLGTNEKI